MTQATSAASGIRVAVLAVAFTLMQWHAGAAAQASAPNAAPDGFKEIKRSDGVCRRDADGAGNAVELPEGPPLPEPDLSCAVSPADAQAWADAANTVFVDTRLPVEFGQFGIRGAVNLGLSDLQTKPYLMSKRLVLLGSGKAEQALYQACAVLKRQGFAQVRVVRGGMASWHASQLALIGRPPSAAALSRIDPAELWRESKFDDNVVMVAASQAALQANLSFSVVLPQVSAYAIKAILDRRRKELKGAPVAAVVLAAGPELSDQQLLQIQQALKPVPVLLYADTADALARQVARQTATWTAQARGPKRPGCGL